MAEKKQQSRINREVTPRKYSELNIPALYFHLESMMPE